MWKLDKYLIAAVIFLSQTAYAQTPAIIEVSTNKRTVKTGEIFTYTLKIEGEFHSPKLDIPKPDNFTIASQSQQRQYTSKGNGTLLIVKITYQLFATNPGTFSIKGASVTDKDKKIEAQTIVIEVTGKPLKGKTNVTPYIRKGIDI
ncbi:MAG: BatD family protein [Candidatus Omnitrophota bacterium]